jgi:outer membrane receptor protein involved in Fe transport
VNLIRTTSSSPEKRRTTACSLVFSFAVFVPLIGLAQQPVDTTRSDTLHAIVRSSGEDQEQYRTGARFSDLLVVRGERAGLRVSPAAGPLGLSGRIRFRGPQTFLDDRLPLVILDGMRLDAASGILEGTARLEDINPDDVESVDVLSPAQAVRYGPNAANGVLIVRTRAPQEGALRWGGYAQVGTATPSDRWPTRMGGFDAANADSVFRNGGCTLLAVAAGSCVQDSIAVLSSPLGRQLRTSLQRQYGLSVRGGRGWVSFYVGGELDGLGSPLSLSEDDITRLQSSGQTVTSAMRTPLHFGGGNVTANVQIRPISTVEINLHGMHMSQDVRAPSFLGDLPNGSGVELQDGYLPLGDAFRVQDLNNVGRWLGSVDVAWRPTGALKITGLAGHDGARIHGSREGTTGFGTESVVANTQDLGLGADADWGPQGLHFQTHVGWEASRINRDSLECLSLTAPGCTGFYQSSDQQYNQHFWSLIVEQGVEIADQLALVATLRRDQFQYVDEKPVHGALQAMWRNGPVRLHAEFGKAGRRAFLFAKPETTRELSAGGEVSFLSNQVTVGGTVYDMRSQVFAPPVFLPTGPPPNFLAGTIGNRGIELYASARLIERGAVALEVAASAWGNRNRLLAMNPPIEIALPGALRQRSFVGYPVAGFWADRPPSFADANGNGIIERNELSGTAEEVWAGTPYPTQGATLAPELTLHNFRIGTSLDYQAGHVIFNRTQWYTCTDGQCSAAIDPTTPLAVQADVAYSGPTLRYFENGDFLAWRELWVTFEVPTSTAHALHVRSASITLAGRNLHTWTGYSGISPEPYAAETQFGTPEAATEPLMPALEQWSLRLRVSY